MQKELIKHINTLCSTLPAVRYLAGTFTVHDKQEKDKTNTTQLVRPYNHAKRVKERLIVALKKNPKIVTTKQKMVVAFIVFEEYKREIDADLEKARKIRDYNNAMMEKFKEMQAEAATKAVVLTENSELPITKHEDITNQG